MEADHADAQEAEDSLTLSDCLTFYTALGDRHEESARSNRNLMYFTASVAVTSGVSLLTIPSAFALSVAGLVVGIMLTASILFFGIVMNRETVMICDRICLEILNGNLHSREEVWLRIGQLSEAYEKRHAITSPLTGQVVSRVAPNSPSRKKETRPPREGRA